MIDTAGHLDTGLLERHRAPTDGLCSTPGRFTNWLGVQTRAGLFPGAVGQDGAIMDAPPVP
ncbi:hypothetical protein ACWCWQ_37815, partial [Streptomyces sp. NPDC001571]